MARFQKRAESTWTEHSPEFGTGLVSFHDSISPAFYEREREAIFKPAWLCVGRVRPFHKTVGDWVEAYTREQAAR